MSERNPLSIEIETDYEEIKQTLQKGRHDPIVGIKIYAEDIYLMGSQEQFSEVYLFGILGDFLGAVESIIGAEKKIVTNDNGPTYLVFEQVDPDTVQFSHCIRRNRADNPSHRDDLDIQTIVGKRQLIEEIIRTSDEIFKEIMKDGEDSEYHDILYTIGDEIEKSKRIYCEEFDEEPL